MLTVPGRVLSAKPREGERYPALVLQRPGRRRLVRVHILVLEAFVGPRPPGHLGRHANDDPNDNALTNLLWGLPIDNSADMVANGRSARGERNGTARLTEAKVIEIRAAYRAGGRSYSQLAREYGVGMVTVANLVTRRTWAHVGGGDAT